MATTAGALLLSVLATALPATGAPSPQADPHPARGHEWTGVGSAIGAAGAEEQGITVLWSGQIIGVFDYSIDEAGAASGSWELIGDGEQEVSGQGVSALGVLEYSGGGPVGGDENALTIGGTATTTGTVSPVGLAINNTNPIPTLSMDVETFCGEMYGSWDVTVASGFEDEGFETSMDGIFVAFDTAIEGYSDVALELLAEAGVPLGARFGSDSAPANVAEAQLTELGSLADSVADGLVTLAETFPNWTRDGVLEVVAQIEAVLNIISNLSDCALEIAPDEILEFLSALDRAVEWIIGKLDDLFAPAGSLCATQEPATGAPGEEPVNTAQATMAYQMLVHLSLRAGTIGAGAVDPEGAAAAERTLINVGSQLLSDIDGGCGTSEDRRRVLAAGATMGWTFTVDGVDIDARAEFETAAADQ